MLEAAAIFSVGLATMYSAHQVADHIFGQTDKMAAHKADPGRIGWSHLLEHVLAYHIIMFAMLLITSVLLSLPITLLGFLSAIAFSAISHAFLDRRWPVRWILENTGSPKFAKMTNPICGMYLADQGLHYFCLWISAMLFACL
jgi:hypothetical protein